MTHARCPECKCPVRIKSMSDHLRNHAQLSAPLWAGHNPPKGKVEVIHHPTTGEERSIFWIPEEDYLYCEHCGIGYPCRCDGKAIGRPAS